MSDTDIPDSDEILAAELALGVVDDAGRAALIVRRDRDPYFDGLVAAWEERLVALTEEIGDEEARAGLWAAIERQLGPDNVVKLRPVRPSLWNNPALWRWIALGSSTLAAACVALLLLAVPPATPRMPMVANLTSSEGKAMYMAMVDMETETVTVMAMDDSPGAEVPELWFIADGAPPQSLGTFSGKGMHKMPLDPGHRTSIHQGVMMAVSMEPIGGSPTGQPTGPVVASGSIISL